MLTSNNSIKMAIIGDKSVGKSAIAVRFLTRRFIGEYDSLTDHVYKTSIKSFLLKRNVKLLDTTGNFLEKNETETNEILDWTHGIILVYDVSERSSFNSIQKMIREIRKNRRSCSIPLILVGNKQDLELRRKVQPEEGKILADHFSAKFYEISAADDTESVVGAMESLLNGLIKSSTTINTKHFQEMAKVSQHLLSSPIHLIDSMLTLTKITNNYDLMTSTPNNHSIKLSKRRNSLDLSSKPSVIESHAVTKSPKRLLIKFSSM